LNMTNPPRWNRRGITKSSHLPRAFTLIELLVVLLVISVLVSMCPFSFAHAKAKSQRIACINNLKEIGTAYRIWVPGPSQADLPPAQQLKSDGGWKELLTNADQGPNCWTNYALMANELGLNPKLLVCPSDERKTATDFITNGTVFQRGHTYVKDNTTLSYFVGVSASDNFPQSIQGGDRNLGTGTVSAPDYGFSPQTGKGNDVAIQVAPTPGAVSWSMKMHSDGNTAGAGNILLGDGSGQQCSSASFRVNWLRNATPTTNWPAGHVPSIPSIRLVFP